MFPTIPELTLKKSVLRGKIFREIKALDKSDWSDFLNIVRDSHTLESEYSEKSIQSLKFDIQLEPRGLEKLDKLYSYTDTDLSEETYLDERNKMEKRIIS